MSDQTRNAPTVSQEEQALLDQLANLRKSKRPREIVEALDAGWLPQGMRLVDPANPEEGRVLTLSNAEAASLVAPLRQLAAARLAVQ